MISKTRMWMGAAAMLAAPLVILIGLRLVSMLDAGFYSPGGHLVFVGGIAALASVIALAAGLSARSASHPGLTYLSVGTAGLGIFMLGHGLTTPGVLSQPFNAWVGRLPHLALAMFAVTLFLTGRRVDSRPARWVTRHSSTIVVTAIGVMLAGTSLVVVEPTLWPRQPWEENAWDAVSVGIVALCLVVMHRHWRRYQLGLDVVQLALTFSAAMSIAATTSIQHGKFQQVSWWDYHAYLLAGFGCAVFAIWSRARRAQQVTETLATVFTDDPFGHIAHGYPEALLRLVEAVEEKDSYTHGHSRRTAQVAIQLGIRMRLSPDRIRVVARGAYLHDLGKIGVPDEILNKPGRLTDHERAIIETHPAVGREIAATSPELTEALEVILHHHERFDGSGYPGGLTGADIPLEARIVAVADVWDALTTDRSYRPGWTPEEALAHIHAGRGLHFDPGAVDAMVDLAAEWGFRMNDTLGSPDVAWEASQTCHQVDPDSKLVGV